MLEQRMHYNANGSGDLVIHADPVALVELAGLAEELNLRSTVKTEPPIHYLNEGFEGIPPNALLRQD
jgi:hypothetical protein